MKDEILHNAEKYQSKLIRRRDKPVKFIWVFLAMMSAGIAGIASCHISRFGFFKNCHRDRIG